MSDDLVDPQVRAFELLREFMLGLDASGNVGATREVTVDTTAGVPLRIIGPYESLFDSDADEEDTAETASMNEEYFSEDFLAVRNELDEVVINEPLPPILNWEVELECDECDECDTPDVDRTRFSDSQSWDIADLLVRENMEVLKKHFGCTEPPVDEIVMLLAEALDRQCENPHLPKWEIVGCLCPGICKPVSPIVWPKLVRTCCKGTCECDECQEDCPICLTPGENGDVIKTSCGHRFHKRCWLKLVESSDKSGGDFLPCPLCRTRVSAMSYKNARETFLRFSSCTCCEHHQYRRPTEFPTGLTPFVEKRDICGDPRAQAIRSLLWYKRARTPTCQCECRAISRKVCRLVWHGF